jgi:threonine aldolase
MAALMAGELRKIPEVTICYPVDINMVFCVFPEKSVRAIQKAFSFHIEDTETRLARLVTAFDTTRKDVMDFIKVVRESV